MSVIRIFPGEAIQFKMIYITTLATFSHMVTHTKRTLVLGGNPLSITFYNLVIGSKLV
jgi:hypothetical protein